MKIAPVLVSCPQHDLPTLEDVARITAQADPVIANLQVTQAYHQISTALAEMLGPTANWCTYATWASKQAGQTIRQQDIARTFERMFGNSPEARRVLAELAACLPSIDAGADLLRSQLAEAIQVQPIFDRMSAAISAGNRKVFDEIGAEFVRFIDTFRGDQTFDAIKIQRFIEPLWPGEPPEAQGYLRQAFTNLYRAMFEQQPRVKTQLILLASLEVGYHEQTRLQPEIAAAFDIPAVNPRRLRRHVLRAFFPRLSRLWLLGDLYLRWSLPVRRFWNPLIELVRRNVRQVVTELMLTLALPGDRHLRLGRDLETRFPESVRLIIVPELRKLLNRIDPTLDSLSESGAEDWTDFNERMHTITDFFRSHIEDPSLFDPPFDPVQVAAIEQGEVPQGQL